MFEKVTLDKFLSLNELDKTSLLFIKEQGCKYCEIAESDLVFGTRFSHELLLLL
jgi:hypothetical protein